MTARSRILPPSLIAWLALAAPAAAPVEETARRLLEARVAAALDPAAAQAELAGLLRREPASPLAEAAARLFRRCRDLAADPRLGEREALELLGVPALHGLARRELEEMTAWDAAARGDQQGWRSRLPAGADPARFLVLGPLGDFADDQYGVPLPPEAGIDLEAPVAGTFGPERWRPLARPWNAERLDPSRGRRRREGAWYTLYQVQAGPAGPAWLLVEPGGSLEAWWNGRKAVDLHAPRGPIPSRLFAPVAVASGWNRLLVKSADADAPAFAVRLVDQAGRPLAGLREEEEARLHALPAPAGSHEAPFLDSSRLLAGEPGPWAALLHGLLLAEGRLHSAGLARAAAAHEAAADRLPPAWEVLHGIQLLEAQHLPGDIRRNRSRALFERHAAAPGPAGVLARLQLARLALGDDRGEEAVTAARQLLAAHPGLFAAEELLYRAFAELKWPAEEERQHRRLLEIAPRRISYLLRQAGRLSGQGDPGAAYELLRAALAADQAHAGLMERLRSLALQLGRLDEAAGWLARERTLEPAKYGLLAEAARLAEYRGEPEEALRLLAELDALEPEEAEWPERQANLALEAGRRDEALAALRRVLDRDPSRHEVRRRLARLEGRDWAAELVPYRPDGAAAMRSFSMKESYRESRSVLVVDHMAVRVFPDGSWINEVYQIRRINDLQGVDDYGQVEPQGEILLLRSWRPDGTVSEPIEVEGQFQMPGLAPGCFVEMLYRDTHGPSHRRPWEITEFVFSSFDEPFLRSRLVVILPRSRRGTFRWGSGLPDPLVEARGDEEVLTFELQDRPRVVQETNMPRAREVIPWVTYGEDRPAAEIRRELRTRLLGAIRGSAEIDRETARVCAGLEGDAARARAIHGFVQDHVPDRNGASDPTAVLLKGEGERWFLLAAMLRSAGIPSDLCLVHGASPATDGEEPPPFQDISTMADWFTLPALRLRPRDGQAAWVLAGMPRFLPPGRIHPAAAGAPVLVLEGEGPLVGILPEVDAEERVPFLAEGEIHLEAKQARGTIALIFPGPLGWQLREMLRQAPEDQRERFVRSQLAPLFRGGVLRSFAFPALDRNDTPLRIELEFSFPGFIQREGGRPAVPTGILPAGLMELADRPARTWPFVLREWRAMNWRITLDPGSSWRVATPPPDGFIVHPLLAWSLSCRSHEDGRLTIDRTLLLRPGEARPGEFPRLLSLFRAVDDAEGRKVIVAPAR